MKNANPVSSGLRLVMLAVAVTVAACGSEKTPPAPPAVKTINEHFPIKVGDRVVRMQLAIHPAEQQRGLMFRRDLGPDDGMLFLYEQPQQMSFWMRNTPTPLDIGFFDPAGTLQEVYPMHAFDERTVSSANSNLRFALEMNQGWYRANGVKPGAMMDLKALAKAVKERGYKPEAFGLKE